MTERKEISKLTDEELLARYSGSGNTEYFGELYNRYIPLLYGVCLKYLRDEDRSKDAVMQLFEDLLPKIAAYRIELFRTWIYTVIKNHCLQIIRKESREVTVDFNSEIMESDEVLHLLGEEETDQERLGLLKICMERLPEQQKRTILLFFMEEMSYSDIVEQTPYNLNQVKSYIQNGKRNLKICIEKNRQ